MLSRKEIQEKLHLAASLVSCKMRFRHFGYCGRYLEISATKGDVAVEQTVLLEIDCLPSGADAWVRYARADFESVQSALASYFFSVP